MAQLVDDQRQVRGHEQGHGGHSPGGHSGAPRGGSSPQIQQEGDRKRQHDHRRRDVGLDRHRRPGRGHDPPGGPTGPERLPRAEEGEGGAGLHESGIPDERGVADQAGRRRGQKSGGQAGGRSTDRARDPPHDRHHDQAEQRDLGHYPRRVAVAEPGRRQQQVVVQRAVMERATDADGLRPEGRQVTGRQGRSQGKHLGPLIRIPAAPSRKGDEPQHRGDEDDRRQAGQLAHRHSQPPGKSRNAQSVEGPFPAGACGAGAHAEASPSAPLPAGSDRTRSGLAVLAAPAAGPGVSGRPAARSPSLATFTAS